MIPSLHADTALFLTSLLPGFLFGLFFEVFRFLRLSFPHKVWMVFLEDLFFFLVITPLFLLYNFAFSDGILRWFTPAGVFIGFFLYLKTLGRLLYYFSDKILRGIRAFLSLLWRLLFSPFIFILKNVTKNLFMKWQHWNIIKKEKRKTRRLERSKKALIRRASTGF